MVTTLNSYFLHLGTLNKICFSRSRGSKNLIFCVAKNISEFSWTAFSHEPSGDYFFICKKLIKLSAFVMTSRRCLFKLVPIVTSCSFNIYRKTVAIDTAWKVPKYRIFSGPNAGKYGLKKTPYLETFHAVSSRNFWYKSKKKVKSLCCTIFWQSITPKKIQVYASWRHTSKNN